MTLALATATWCGASAAAGQSTPETKEARIWRLEGLRAGYCVRFLMNPKDAAGELKSGFVLLPANQDSTLHPALRGVVANQPEFGSWIPSSLCLYYLNAVRIGKRRVVEKDPRRYQLLGAWTVATREQQGGAHRDIVLDLYASRSSLLRAAENASVRLREVHSTVGERADTTPDFYGLRIGKTLLAWTGRPTGDSTRVESPLIRSWSVTGLRNSVHGAQFVVAPEWSRALVGSLQVEGKGDLAKAMRASPIRFVGPLYRGGSGELRFSR